jgi:hypothetical protein
MIEHIVMIRWKDGTPSDGKEALLVRAQAMAGIEGVISVSARRDIGRAKPEQNKGITDVLVIAMKDRAALEHYAPHPIHREFGGDLMAAAEDITILDLPV